MKRAMASLPSSIAECAALRNSSEFMLEGGLVEKEGFEKDPRCHPPFIAKPEAQAETRAEAERFPFFRSAVLDITLNSAILRRCHLIPGVRGLGAWRG